MSKKFNWELFNKIPVIGIMRNFPPQYLKQVVGIYQKAGFTNLEITMNSKDPAETIKSLRSECGDAMNIGAGTVGSVNDLEVALDAGAQFIVAPIVNKQVIKQCVKEDVPVFPGAYTPTEIYKAWSLGASMIKVFPAGGLGPQYIKDVLEPLNNVKLVPTGGVSIDNFTDYLKAGATGVALATSLFPKDIIANEQWDALVAFYTGFINKYRQYKVEKA